LNSSPRYGIITTGSRGDVQPFVALALALLARGHDVTIVASENFRDFIDGFGVRFIPVTGNSEQIINSPVALKLLEGGSVFKFFYHLQKATARSADQSNRDILEACRHFDFLITSILPLPVVYSIAEKYQKSCAAVFLSLPPILTREFPFQAIGTKGHPWFNKLSYRLLGLGYSMIRRQIDRFRKEIDLPRANVMKAALRSGMLAITAVSEQILKQPADWPPNAHVTGFFYLPPSARQVNREIPEGLDEWLAAGDKPVYIGFGSIPVPDQDKFCQALQGLLAHQRVVLGVGWSVLNALPSHPNLFVTKYVDHDWLMPQCASVVVHGGIGTIAAALRSGAPIVVVSVLADQPVNGTIIEEKGLGVHIPFKKLTPDGLSRALLAARQPNIVENCKSLAARIKTEDGVGRAVELIEAFSFECTLSNEK
jgi:UDP:flavonoid glycosyltransferase YjiC (YdhE family)